jgi:hypothetical protein
MLKQERDGDVKKSRRKEQPLKRKRNTTDQQMLSNRRSSHRLIHINSLGEGLVNVCGRNGNIKAGDLIETSTLPGKGQRQDDDIVRSKSVAKAREDVTFDHPDDVKRIACIYLCG